MKKVTDFLEKNCQWVAIGAGALFLVWMVYSFVLTNTAFSVSVAGKETAPGDVDDLVKKNYADPLDTRIKDTRKIDIKVPSFGDITKLEPTPTPEYQLAWVNSNVANPTQQVIQQTPTQQNPNPNLPNVPGPAVVMVTQLPAPPAPTELGVASGRTSANVPAPMAIAVGDPNNPQPQPAQPVVNAQDIDWVTVNFSINLVALAKEFQRCNIPPQQAFTTCFLDVELVRKQLVGPGPDDWGPETVCAKLTTSTQPPVPPAKAGKQEMQNYLTWATANTIEILQPKFYEWIKGDQWTLSKDLVGTVAAGGGAPVMPLGKDQVRVDFNPDQYVDMDAKTFAAAAAALNPALTAKEKQLIAKARSDKRTRENIEKAKSNRPAPTPRGGGGGGRRGGGGDAGYAPEDPVRPAAGRPPYARPYGTDIMDGGESRAAGAAGQQSNFSQMFPIQTGEFDPRILVNPPAGGQAAPGTWVCWAHDWKAEPGKTYRYMVRYKIKSPVWNTNKVTKPQELSNEFAITSQNSEWTPPVTVPSVVTFFFASQGIGTQRNARVDIYKYEGGELHKETFPVSPGDIIGTQKNGVDYSTGVTLVDLRPDPKGDRLIAWLLTPEGVMQKRDLKADADSPQRKAMEEQSRVAAAANAGGAAAAAAGGAPAMINATR